MKEMTSAVSKEVFWEWHSGNRM